MRCRNLISYSAMAAGLALVAPTVQALPTDVGRTADVYENAVRVNTAASRFVDRKVFVPEVVAVAEAVPADPVPQVVATFEAPVVYDPAYHVSLRGLAPLVVADVVAEPAVVAEDTVVAAATVEADDITPEIVAAAQETPVENIVPDAIQTVDVTAQQPAIAAPAVEPALVASVVDAPLADLTVPSVQMADSADGPAFDYGEPAEPAIIADVAPELYLPGLEDEFAVTAVLAEQSNTRLRYDQAFGVPLVAVALESLDVPPARAYGIDEIIPASVTWTPVVIESAVVSSRRPVAATNPERLLSAMADSDENLVIRDGGEDGPDTMMMSSDVLFDFGAATLSEEAMETLASIGNLADNVPVIEVLGHTDAIGREEDNLSLGQQRAEAVRAWLLENSDFSADRVIATGVGEVDPVADNVTPAGLDNPTGRSQNRRVEFAFLTADGDVEEAADVQEVAAVAE